MEIKPCCHYCEDSQHVRKHGASRARIQRYFCKSCNKTFQTRYIYQGNEANIHHLIKKLLAEGLSHSAIALQLGVGGNVISRHILMLTSTKDELSF